MLVACSDDGVPATETEGSTGSASAATSPTTVDPSAATTTAPTTSPPTTGTTDDAESSDGPGSTSGVTVGTNDPSSSSGEPTGSTTDSSSGSESTTGTVPGTTCESVEDCVVVDDCCTCAAQHVDDPVPDCDILACFQSTCSAQGVPGIGVQCVFGSCEFVPVDCNAALVTCEEPPPPCPEDTLPSVVDGCWGTCVPSEACDFVPDCSWCPGDETCVTQGTQLGLFYSCVPVDPSCDGTADCDCMGSVCQNPFMCTDENAGELTCVCPVCG